MDQDRRTPPPPPRTGSNPHATTSSGLSVRGSPSSAMLGLSSPASPHRRFSPSLYPPPAPSPGRLASGSGSGSGSASRFGQIPPSSPVAAPGGRQRRTHALPSPFLSELASIRRMGASLFGDLDDARPTNHHRGASATPQAAIHGQQPQQQAWPSPTLTMSRDSGLRTPPPSGSFPQVAPPPVSRQQQPPSPGRPPLSSNRFAGFPASAFWSQPRRQVQSSSSGVPPPLALQQQQTTYHPDPSSTDLAPLPSGSGSIFSKSSFTDLAPPLPGETTMFGSSSWSSSAQLAPDTASHTVAMYSHAQSSSDSELQPLPPSLQMQSPDQTPSWQWKFSGNGSSSSTYSDFEAPILDVAVGLGPRFQIKEEPVDFDAPCTEMQPELISLDDDDDDDGLDALLQSFKSSTEPATSSEGSLQLGGSGSRPSVLGIIDEGSGQSWDWDIAKQNLQFPLLPSPTDRLELNSSHGPSVWSTGDTSGQGWAGMPALASMFDQMSIAGGTMSIGQGWPAMPAAAGQYGLLDNSGSPWPAVPLCASMFDQMSIGGGSMSTGQGWPETPAAAVEAGVFDNIGGGSSPLPAMPSCGSMFDQMNIGGGNMSMSQGWPETPPSAAAGEAGVFDNSGSNSSPWPAMPSSGSMFDQMNIGGGSMSMGQGWPETPPEAASNYSMFDFDNTGGSSSSAWASNKPCWNFSSSSTENSTPVPKLMLGGMEKPRLPRRLPSLAALVNSMSPNGSCGDLFSVAEIQTINKDKRLKEIVNTDPKRVKRILNNRASAANLRARRNNALDLS